MVSSASGITKAGLTDVWCLKQDNKQHERKKNVILCASFSLSWPFETLWECEKSSPEPHSHNTAMKDYGKNKISNK